jgi:hypothetical protein
VTPPPLFGHGGFFGRLLLVAAAVQSTLIFSLNFHLIGEWHDKREVLVQLNGLIETERTSRLKRTHLQHTKRDNSSPSHP